MMYVCYVWVCATKPNINASNEEKKTRNIYKKKIAASAICIGYKQDPIPKHPKHCTRSR